VINNSVVHGSGIPNYGKKFPNTVRNKGNSSIAGSIAKRGESNPMFNKKHKDSTKKILSDIHMGKVWKKKFANIVVK
jgi:hypothetical protein